MMTCPPRNRLSQCLCDLQFIAPIISTYLNAYRINSSKSNVADCGLITYMKLNKIQQSFNLPRPNINRDIKILNNDPICSYLPKLDFPKVALLKELLKHALVFYFLCFRPDIIQNYIFEQNSSEASSKIINFFAFFQGLPIFLAIQGFLELDLSISKKVFIPLSISDSLLIYAASSIKPRNENWPIAVIMIISIHSFSIIFKFCAYISG